MKILVAVKRVVDFQAKIIARSDGSGVETANVKMSMNPFDEVAVEEAVRLKERGLAKEIIAVSAGPEACREQITAALAMGADRGMLIEHDGHLEPLTVAKLLRAYAAREAPDLILLGKQAIDDDMNATGQMLAALLAWPQGAFTSGLEIVGGCARVTREIDDGQEILDLQLPAIVTVDLRLNTPRYISASNVMTARKKMVQRLKPADLGVDPTPRLRVLRVFEPSKRQAGLRVSSVFELLEKLRHEAKVI